jgi:CRISPR-associated protein Csy1
LNIERTLTPRAEAIRRLLHEHVDRRRRRALAKWEGKTDALAKQEIRKAEDKYQLDVLLQKGRAGSAYTTIATHIAKATHPDIEIKFVTNPNVRFSTLPHHTEIGSHLLNDQDSLADTTGNGAYNAAAYELYLLLDLRFEGSSLGHWLEEGDADAIHAFSPLLNDEEAASMAQKYAVLLRNKAPRLATDTRAKQLYWLVGEDASQDADYHLLVPFYASQLAHAVYGVIQEDRFGEANKLARQARRDRQAHDGVFRDYPNLAVRKLGGSHPENVSELTRQQRGYSYLLSCAPPSWKSSQLRAPWGISSIFDRVYGPRDGVRTIVHAFRDFLHSNPPSNAQTRNRVDTYVDSLIDELVELASGYQHGLTPGWSRELKVELVPAEQLWLDPYRAAIQEEKDFREDWLRQDWPAQVGQRFANWLNSQFGGRLPVGDAESRQWQKELLHDKDEDGWAQHLQRLRKQLDAPSYIPVRESVA